MDIKEIAKEAGGVVALSKALGLSRGAVSQWDVVPSDRVLAVCDASGWRVTPHQLRPDLYPNQDDALPPGTAIDGDRRAEANRRQDVRRGDCADAQVEKAA